MKKMLVTKRLIILANSIRPGGRCVAGICADTGQWVRPVPRHADRAVPDTRSISRMALLDIVQVPLAGDRPNPPDRYQRENWFVDTWDWEVVGRCSVEDATALCEAPDVVLYTNNDRVEPSYMDSLPPAEWKSLLLLNAKVSFDKDYWDRTRWRATFKDRRGNLLSLKVSDPAVSAKLDKGQDVSKTCLLTISLAGPWAPPDGSQPERCYKLVAGVIEL